MCVYKKCEKYNGMGILGMERPVEISQRMMEELKEMGMQALELSVGRAHQTEEADNCKGPGAEVYLTSLGKTNKLE